MTKIDFVLNLGIRILNLFLISISEFRILLIPVAHSPVPLALFIHETSLSYSQKQYDRQKDGWCAVRILHTQGSG